jgi:tetratricopeptide (TPR) repeat protein
LDLLLALGIETHLQGQYNEAVDVYFNMLRIVHSQYGDNNFIQTNIDNIRKSSTYAITLSLVSDIYFNMAVSYQYVGLIRESSEAYNTCLDFKPDHASCRLNLAALHHQHGRVLDAIHHYEHILKQFMNIESKEFTSVIMMTSTTAPAGTISSSVDAIISRLTQNQQYIMVKSNLGNAYLKYGRGLESRMVLQSLLSELDVAATHNGCFPTSHLLDLQRIDIIPKYISFIVPRMSSTNLQDSELYHHDLVGNTTQQQQFRSIQRHNCDTLLKDEMQSLNNLLLANRASCHWHLMVQVFAVALCALV